MNHSMDDSGLYNTPLNRTVRAIKKSMSQYGITRPLTIEYKSCLNNLPKTPERRKDAILRQMNCSEFPRSVHEIAHKLNELYVYSDEGKSLESVPIAHAVTNYLNELENEFPPPGIRKAMKQINTCETAKKDVEQKKISKTVEVKNRTRKDLQKYSRIGEIRRKLFSMPDYVQSRNRKGVKLPGSKLKSSQHHLDLNISKVKVLKTKMGRGIVKQEAKRKKIENLKEMLNPAGKKLKKF